MNQLPVSTPKGESMLGIVSLTMGITGYAMMFSELRTWDSLSFYYFLTIELIAAISGFVVYRRSQQKGLLSGLGLAGATLGVIYLGAILMLFFSNLFGGI